MKDMIEDLNAKGIRLKVYNVGSHKTTCPRCSSTRKNPKDPCLWVNVTEPNLALWQCYNCFWTGAAGDVSTKRHESMDAPAKRQYVKPDCTSVPAPSQTAQLPANIVEFFKSRKISEEVIKKNKIYFDSAKSAICFPYFDQGKLLNIKRRTLDKKFWLEGGAKLVLYGLDSIKMSNNLTLVIVEGEMDKLALETCGVENVLSVPNGAVARRKAEEEPISNKGQFEYFQHSEALFKAAKKVIIAVDDDPAGENLRYELTRRIGAAKVWNVRFPEKDANGCLMKLSIDETLNALNDAAPVPIKGLYNVSDFQETLVHYFNEGMKAGVPTGWENLDHLYSIMPGELTVVTGIPNSGKSEWVASLLLNLAKSENWKFAVFSPEHSKEEHVVVLAEKVMEKSASPKTREMTEEELLNAASWIEKHFHFISTDDYSQTPNLDWILEMASIAVMRYGINGFVLDPWNQIEASKPSAMNDSDFIGICITKVMRWARMHKVKVWVVAHPTKIRADKENKTPVPTLYDINGSANWVNMPDNGLVIYRSEDVSSTTEIHVKKIRRKFVGKRGHCSLRFDTKIGKYTTPASEQNCVPKDGGKGAGYQDMETY